MKISAKTDLDDFVANVDEEALDRSYKVHYDYEYI